MPNYASHQHREPGNCWGRGQPAGGQAPPASHQNREPGNFWVLRPFKTHLLSINAFLYIHISFLQMYNQEKNITMVQQTIYPSCPGGSFSI